MVAKDYLKLELLEAATVYKAELRGKQTTSTQFCLDFNDFNSNSNVFLLKLWLKAPCLDYFSTLSFEVSSLSRAAIGAFCVRRRRPPNLCRQPVTPQGLKVLLEEAGSIPFQSLWTMGGPRGGLGKRKHGSREFCSRERRFSAYV